MYNGDVVFAPELAVSHSASHSVSCTEQKRERVKAVSCVTKRAREEDFLPVTQCLLSAMSARQTTSSGPHRGGNKEEYIHHVTKEEADLLTAPTGPLGFFGLGRTHLLDIQRATGANVQLIHENLPVQGTNAVIIHGSRSQIEKAVSLINRVTGAQETISENAEAFWLQWVDNAFPDLDSRAYFLPPVYLKRVPMTRQAIAGHDVVVLQAPGGQTKPISSCPAQVSVLQPTHIQESDIRDDAAMQRVFHCLQAMSDQNEVLVGMTQFKFGDYLNEPCYAAAVAQMPSSRGRSDDKSQRGRKGEFDILLIHRSYGFLVCEVKAIGDRISNMTPEEVDQNVRKKLKQAVSQLDRAKSMLSHLVSDIPPGLRVTKTVAVPNLTPLQVQQALSGDPNLTKELCRCLGARDLASAIDLCLCSYQLSAPQTPWDLSSDTLTKLGQWWQRRVAGSGPDGNMTSDVYRRLVARFCGPATTVTLPCTFLPRLNVKTLGQVVSLTGECYAQITLFPEQVDLLNASPPLVFLAGPPGTGKTVVLQLMGTEWLRRSNDVYVVSTWDRSRAVCHMLLQLLQQTIDTLLTGKETPGKVYLLDYDLAKQEDMDQAVSDLSQRATEGQLYVIADEARRGSDNFQTFCQKLQERVPGLHLWAASCYHGHAPPGWRLEYLTRSLRSPPAIVREVRQAGEIFRDRSVRGYGERGVPDHTDGPAVTVLNHRGPQHQGGSQLDCLKCGQDVASFLRSLRVGPANGQTTPLSLQYRDVLLLCSDRDVSADARVLTGLWNAGYPVRVVRTEASDSDDLNDVATASSDVVWLVHGDYVRGLERKVVVCLGVGVSGRLHHMSRCTSQLVVVS